MSRSKKTQSSTSRTKRNPVRAQQDRHWAQRWFDGHGACPVCGGDRIAITATRSGGDTRLETWRCERPRCPGAWRVELRESAVAAFDAATNTLRDWYERADFAPVPHIHIEIEDGVALGVRTAADSVPPQPMPRFTVREYESDGSLERERVSGVDAEGREYHEHDLDVLDRDL
jgi:hypothetical protein